MATEERASKLRKLENFRRSIPFVSAAGLSAILQEVDKVGVPELHQRKHLQEARDAKVMQHQSYGPMITDIKVHLTTGEERSLQVINFLSLLNACYEQGGSMHQLLKETAVKFPPSPSRPWHLIFYSDEIVPGNVFIIRHIAQAANVLCIICRIWGCQFGKGACLVCCLCHQIQCGDQSVRWYEPSHCPTSEVHYFIATLALWKDSGLLFKRPSPRRQIENFFQAGFSCFRMAWLTRAYGPLKGTLEQNSAFFAPTWYLRESSLPHEVLTTQAFDPSALQLATDQDLQGTFSRLASRAGTVSKDDFKLWEQAVGFNYNEHSLPWDPILGPHLKPCSQFVHDWMHTRFVGGVFPVLMGLTLNSLQTEFKTNTYKLLAELHETLDSSRQHQG